MNESAFRHLNFPCLSRKYVFVFGPLYALERSLLVRTEDPDPHLLLCD
jgi:hypothetical protein